VSVLVVKAIFGHLPAALTTLPAILENFLRSSSLSGKFISRMTTATEPWSTTAILTLLILLITMALAPVG